MNDLELRERLANALGWINIKVSTFDPKLLFGDPPSAGADQMPRVPPRFEM